MVREREREEELLTQAGDPLIALSEVEGEEQRHLYDPYVPYGTVTAIMGSSHVGKSSFAAWITTQHTIGTWGPAGHVIHIGDEDSINRLKERARWFGADESRYHYWDVNKVTITFPAGVKLLERRVKQLAEETDNSPLVIVVDTATEYLDPALEINSHQHVTSAIKPLRQMAERLGVAIIGVVHTNRQKSADPQDLTGSSKAWYDRSKSALFIGADPDDKEIRHVFQEKASYSTMGCGPALEFNVLRQEKLFKLELMGESDREFREVFDSRAEVKQTKTELTDEFLQTYVNEGKLPVKLQELEDAFLAQYGEGAVTSPISLKTLRNRRPLKGWITKKLNGVQYVGRPLDFKDFKGA